MGDLIRPNPIQWQDSESNPLKLAESEEAPFAEFVTDEQWRDREGGKIERAVRAFMEEQDIDTSALSQYLEQHDHILKDKPCYQVHLRSIHKIRAWIAAGIANCLCHSFRWLCSIHTWEPPQREDVARAYRLLLANRSDHIRRNIHNSVRIAQEQERFAAFVQDQEQLKGELIGIKDVQEILGFTNSGAKAALKRAKIQAIVFLHRGPTTPVNINLWVKSEIEAFAISRRASLVSPS